MSSANSMSNGIKVKPLRVSKRVSSGKSAFWNGVFEGFSGPLLMGAPILKKIARTGSGNYVIALGNDVQVTTLSVSSRSMAKAMARAAALVMDKNNLILQPAREKILDGDGKFRTIEINTIVPKPANEPRK